MRIPDDNKIIVADNKNNDKKIPANYHLTKNLDLKIYLKNFKSNHRSEYAYGGSKYPIKIFDDIVFDVSENGDLINAYTALYNYLLKSNADMKKDLSYDIKNLLDNHDTLLTFQLKFPLINEYLKWAFRLHK